MTHPDSYHTSPVASDVPDRKIEMPLPTLERLRLTFIDLYESVRDAERLVEEWDRKTEADRVEAEARRKAAEEEEEAKHKTWRGNWEKQKARDAEESRALKARLEQESRVRLEACAQDRRFEDVLFALRQRARVLAEKAMPRRRQHGPRLTDIDRGKQTGAASVTRNGITYTYSSTQAEPTSENPFAREEARLRQLKREDGE